MLLVVLNNVWEFPLEHENLHSLHLANWTWSLEKFGSFLLEEYFVFVGVTMFLLQIYA